MARPMRICTPAGLCQLRWMPHKHHNMSHGSSNFSHSQSPVPTTYPSASSSSSLSWPTYYPTTTHSGIGGVSTGNDTKNMMDMSNMSMTTSLTVVDVFLIVSSVAFVVLGALGFIFRKKIKRGVNRCLDSCGCFLGRRRSRNSSSNRNRNNNNTNRSNYSGSADSSVTYVDIELNDLAPTTAAAAIGACSCSPRMRGTRAMFRRILPSRRGNNDEPMTCNVCGGCVATPGPAAPHGNDTFAGVRLDATGRATVASVSVSASTSLASPASVIRVGAREGPANIAGLTLPLPRLGSAFSNNTTLAGSSSGAAASAAEEPHLGSPLPRWPFLHQERAGEEEHGSGVDLLGVGGHPSEVTFVLGDDDSDDDDVVVFGESAAGVSQSPSQQALEPGSAF